MGRVEDDPKAVFLNPGYRSHIRDQGVVAKTVPAFRDEILLTSERLELLRNILNVPWRKKLAFFHIHDPAGLRGRFQQIGLAAEKCGDLEDVDPLTSDRGLLFIVDVGRHRDSQFLSDSVQQLATLEAIHSSKGVDGTPIGLVVARLEDEIDIHRLRDLLDSRSDIEKELFGFDDTRAENEDGTFSTEGVGAKSYWIKRCRHRFYPQPSATKPPWQLRCPRFVNIRDSEEIRKTDPIGPDYTGGFRMLFFSRDGAICLDLRFRGDTLAGRFRWEAQLSSMEGSSEQTSVINQCPECSQSVDVTALPPFAKIECPGCGTSVRMKTLMGQYHLTGILGEGGMSQVFRAVDTHLGREVALKVLHPELSRDSALTSMFEREAKLTASILHPNVVKVYTVGQEQGYFFIAMELVRATSLEEMIANKGSLSESDVLNIAHDVTSGLAAAQEEGLIHRDIKPGNMLVTEDGTAKLVDFGLAVQQGGEDESEDLWATPFYVPPEKLEGEKDTYLGDIYSLGATLFHALAGSPPFDANTSSLEELKVIKKQDLDLKSLVPGLSKSTLRLVEKMMSYDAVSRPQSYADILDHIETIQKRQFGVTKSSRRKKPVNRKAVIALGVCSALLAVVVALNVFRDRQQEEDPGGVGIVIDDRVISAGDNKKVAQFLEGRQLISEGNFRNAEPIFDSLVVETTLSPSIRMWSLFFQGTTRLFLGNEEDARQSFALIEAINPEGESDIGEVVSFMKETSRVLSDPLPVLEPEEAFESESLEVVGFLVAGLKNWQLGQFENGLELLKRFEESSIPSGYEWMEPLQAQVSEYQRDWQIFSSLPNPNRESSRALGTQKATLQAALSEVKTRGALRKTIQERIERIDTIRELEKKEAEERLRAEQEERSMTTNPPTDPVKDPVPAPTTLSPEEEKEKVVMQGLISDLNQYQATFLFSAAIAKVNAYEPETKAGEKWKAGLLEGYTYADQFLPFFSKLLSEGEYEGVIRRREGVPLEARITAATLSILTLDLGFGPNEVEIELFDPDWMTEAAEGLMPPVSEETAEERKRLVYFSLVNGLLKKAERLADEISAVDDEFALVWEGLMELKPENL